MKWGAMSDVHHEIASEVARRQAGITAALQALQELEPDHPQYEAAFDRVVRAGGQLLAYERTIPAQLAEPHRRISAHLVRTVAAVQFAEAAALITLAGVGIVGWGWIILLVVPLFAAGFGWTYQVTTENHGDMRASAYTMLAPMALAPPVVLHVISRWFIILLVFAWIVAFSIASDAEIYPASKGEGVSA
jgi:hypothetical protein